MRLKLTLSDLSARNGICMCKDQFLCQSLSVEELLWSLLCEFLIGNIGMLQSFELLTELQADG